MRSAEMAVDRMLGRLVTVSAPLCILTGAPRGGRLDSRPSRSGAVDVSQSHDTEAAMSETKEHSTVDLSKGVAASALTDGGLILGRVGDEEVVLARSGSELFAIRAHCSHYRGPLVKGLVVGDTVRCPLHHACFSLRTGEALRAPALDPIACWRVEQEGDRIFVREKLPQARPARLSTSVRQLPSSIVIVGGGAAGVAAAEMLRRKGYD